MIRINVGDTIFNDRFKIVKWGPSGGRCITYFAIDEIAKWPWQRNVFLKQYDDNDIRPDTEEAKALEKHFDKLRERLLNTENYLSLPIKVGKPAEVDSMFAVFPFIQGTTLQKKMYEEGLSQEQRVRIAVSLTHVVRAMHEQHIAHLDLKPENVMVQESWDRIYIRLIDLDSAQINGSGLRKHVLGTDKHMSPEHINPERFGEVSAASDIFTLGIMLFELFFNAHPFTWHPIDRTSSNNYKDCATSEAFSIPPDSNCAHNVLELIAKCLSAYPQNRPMASQMLPVLNEYQKAMLDAIIVPERLLFRLEGAGIKRVYYEDMLIGKENLRGAIPNEAVKALSRTILRLRFQGIRIVVTGLSSECKIKRYDDLLEPGESKALPPGITKKLQIGELMFNITVEWYRN